MVTAVSEKTREAALKDVERLRKENEQLKAGIQEVKQGVMFAPKDGRMAIALYEVNPATEYPVKDGTTRKDSNGKEHPNYRIYKWFYVNEADLVQVGSLERKACNIYYIKRGRKP